MKYKNYARNIEEYMSIFEFKFPELYKNYSGCLAASEYVSMLMNNEKSSEDRISKKRIAQKYKVSDNLITKYYKELITCIDLNGNTTKVYKY